MVTKHRLTPAPSLEQQKRAANPETHAWVSASAGTGKTKVLTDRVLSLLLSGVLPEKILCLTFTKAAAQEMSERLMKALSTWATLPKNNLKKELESLLPENICKSPIAFAPYYHRAQRLLNRVLESPQGLSIQTLHSFCQSFLQRFPIEASVAPGFSAIDDQEQQQYLRQAQEVVLMQNPSHDIKKAILFLSRTFGAETFEEKLNELILTSRRPGRSLPDAIELSLEKELGISALENESHLLQKMCSPLKLLALLGEKWTFLKDGGLEDQKRFKALQTYLNREDSIPDLPSFLALSNSFLTKEGTPRLRLLNKKTATAEPDLESSLQKTALLIEKAQNTLQTLHIAKVSHAFLMIAKAVLKTYEALKEQQNLLDYDDLINKTVDVLKDPASSDWVLYKMDGGLDHILLDEAQDTNASQWHVIEALTEEFFSGQGIRETSPTLFVVGDVKQSIYSFQGANPVLFESYRHAFRTRAQAASSSWQDIGLNLSFRSAPAILKSVDYVFESSAREGVRTLEETPLLHEAFRLKTPGKVDLWPLEKEDPGSQNPQEDPGLSSSQKLARKIATTIRQWLDEKRPLYSRERPVRPSDILILFQRRGPFFQDLHRALKAANVPVSGEDRLNLQNQIAIQDLVALGRFLLLPEDDASLACVLRSPLIGLSEEALFKLCHDRPSTVWNSLIRAAQKDPDTPETDKYQQAHAFLSGLFSLVDRLTPYELYSKVLIQENKQEAFLKRLGNQVLDPLQEFITCTRQYEQKKTPSLQGFLNFFSKKTREIKRDLTGSLTQEVRLMTVHGAKGLQAPIVFLPDTVRIPRLRDSFLWQQECPVWNPPKNSEPKLLKSMKSPLQKSLQEEYNRLLYVAMTRAEDELYVAGFETKTGVPDTCWYALIRESLQKHGSLEAPEHWTLKDACPAPAKKIKVPDTPVSPELSHNALPAWITEKASSEKIRQQVHLASPDNFLFEEGLIISEVSLSEISSISPSKAPSRRHPENQPLSFRTSLDREKAMHRGTLFHAIIELLPDIPSTERLSFIKSYLASSSHKDLPISDLERMFEQLLGNPDFAFLFSGQGSYEVPICGFIEKELVNGQIDFMIQESNEIKLIDFKTNLHPATHLSEVPDAYLTQLQLYKKLVQPLYPENRITTWILWTTSCVLMPLEAKKEVFGKRLNKKKDFP